ncbi:unnamed protein product [Brassica rapa]|uniref:Transcription factor CBF/NF-Y/archaeal histone domain-containing protein n=1 Tax=Brassica campestris TaxID=3711 RepID=A0A8D9GHS2_BRACM|nr:unnamed protein product [Brassica rapa]
MANTATSPGGDGGESGGSVREQDRYLPIANISRIMKKALPPNGKIGKDAKDTVQECVSEFISFITSEASDKCQKEKRKTVNGEDLLWAMSTLGFEDYLEPLKVYLARYREASVTFYRFPISVLKKIKNLKSTMDSQEAAREKVDFSQLVRDKESEWNHRRSLAWDSAFFTTPGVLDHEELFGSLKLGENEIDENQKDFIKKTLLPCVSSDIATRPSFAWDNAFLTEPGVLDAEELSLVNNGFTSNTQPRNSADSMTTATEGSRFSVSSIELDLFNDLRASLSNVKETRAEEIQRKLPDGNKRAKLYKLKSQRLSLIPQPKAYTPPSSSSLSSSVSKSLTPRQAKPEKKVVASELGHKGSKSIIRSSYSGYKGKDLASSSSGLRFPLPKMGFFDSENEGDKENKEPNASANRRRRHKSKLGTLSPQETPNVLGQRKTRK